MHTSMGTIGILPYTSPCLRAVCLKNSPMLYLHTILYKYIIWLSVNLQKIWSENRDMLMKSITTEFFTYFLYRISTTLLWPPNARTADALDRLSFFQCKRCAGDSIDALWNFCLQFPERLFLFVLCTWMLLDSHSKSILLNDTAELA